MNKHYLIVNKEDQLIDHSLKVQLPNGTFNSVNVFDYNLAYMVHSFDPKKWVTVQLDDGSFIQVSSLKPIYENMERKE